MKGMTCFEIDHFFLNLERKAQNGQTLVYARQGAAGIEKPFVCFLAPDDINEPETILACFRSVYEVMDFVQEYLTTHPATGYFYA